MSAARGDGAAISGTLSFRGGALLDDAIDAPHWRLAPTSGRSLLSDLRRSALASGSDPATPAGYILAPDLAGPLALADVGATIRTERFGWSRTSGRPICASRASPSGAVPSRSGMTRSPDLLTDDIAAWTRT